MANRSGDVGGAPRTLRVIVLEGADRISAALNDRISATLNDRSAGAIDLVAMVMVLPGWRVMVVLSWVATLGLVSRIVQLGF